MLETIAPVSQLNKLIGIPVIYYLLFKYSCNIFSFIKCVINTFSTFAEFFLNLVNGVRLSFQIDVSRSKKLHLNSENGYKMVQSAGNFKGSSETIRQLSNLSNNKERLKDSHFNAWFAGIIDGDGSFDIRQINGKNVLKAIVIKFHFRDIKILNVIQNHFHFGRIIYIKNRPYCKYMVSTQKEMRHLCTIINGMIRLKVDGFMKACSFLDIDFIEADYNIKPLDPYFAGLIDTDGSIIFNFASNRIECALELKYNQYSARLNLDNVVPNYKPAVYLRKKTNQDRHKVFHSIAFKYQTVNEMIFLYEYFMINRLYCDMKFYRVSKIKSFLEIRKYKTEPFETIEYKIYSAFILDFIQYSNPLWNRVPFVKLLNIS